MTFEHRNRKAFTASVLLILLPNLVFFIWRGSSDTLVSYEHLMINTILLSCGFVVAYGVGLFQITGSGGYCAVDIWVFLFTMLIISNIKGGYETIVTDKNLLKYAIGVGIYSVVRLYSKQLNSSEYLPLVFFIPLLVETGFLIVESIRFFGIQTVGFSAFRGSFDNSGKLGIYLAILYPCTLYMMLKSSKRTFAYRSFLLTVIVLLILFLLLSLSRIAWISVFVSSVIMASWYVQSKKKRRFFYLLVGILTVVLVSAILLIKQDSASGRVLVWSITAQHLSDYWLVGTGYGRFSSVYNLWQSDYFSAREIIDKNFYIADNTFFAFNEFLQTGIELGWLGMLLWIILTCWLVAALLKKSIWALSLVAFLVTCQASYPFRIVEHQVLFFSLLGLFSNSQIKNWKSGFFCFKIARTIFVSPLLLMIPIIFFSITAIFCIYQYFSIPIWREARNEFSFDERKGIVLYTNANERLHVNAEFLLEYGVHLTETDSIHTAKEVIEKSKASFVSQIHLIELGYCYEQSGNYAIAEKYYQQAIYVSPSKLAPRYQLLLFYDKMGRIAEAQKVGKDILEITPKIKSDERAELIKNIVKKYLEKN